MFTERWRWLFSVARMAPNPSGASTKAAISAPPNACGMPNRSTLLSNGMANFSAIKTTAIR